MTPETDATGLANRPPSIWPSLITAVMIAVIVPQLWLAIDASATFLYTPLTFGIVWPLLVAVQTIQPNRSPRPHLIRVYVAIPLLGVSALCSIPVVAIEAMDYRSALAERHTKQAVNDRDRREMTADSAAIRTRGVASFSLPLTPSQGSTK